MPFCLLISLTREEQKGDLPEGFFDDPKMDAKVCRCVIFILIGQFLVQARKVEFKDPLDEQWEEFKKSISKESEVDQ